MAVCRFVSPNRLRESGVHIEDTTFDTASLPAVNLQHPNLFMKARSAAGGADQHVTFDLGAALSARGVGIPAHTIPSSPATLRFAGHSSDSWADPASGWLTLTWNADKIIGFFSEDKTYRYWRLEVGASAQFDIGGLVFGPVWQPSFQSEDLQISYTQLAPGLSPTKDGRTNIRWLNVGFGKLTQAECLSLREIYERHRQIGEPPYHFGSEPGLFCFDATNKAAADGLQRYSIYGVLSGDLQMQTDSHGYAVNIDLQATECL
jgi:hypothetical protein